MVYFRFLNKLNKIAEHKHTNTIPTYCRASMAQVRCFFIFNLLAMNYM